MGCAALLSVNMVSRRSGSVGFLQYIGKPPEHNTGAFLELGNIFHMTKEKSV